MKRDNDSKDSNYKMTIVVPVYNELANIPRLGITLLEYLTQSKVKSKVLFIDDGSTDGSFNEIERLCTDNPNLNYIKFSHNCGLSSAIKAGIDHCNTELLGYIDADLQTTPFDFDKLLAYIDDYEAVIGIRNKRNDSWNKKIQSLLANNIRRALINDGIIDTGCPLKVIKTTVAQAIPFFDGLHRFIPAMIQLQHGRIKQVPVQHFKRKAGTSKFNIFNRSFKPLQDTFAFRWMRSRYINYKIEKTDIY
ncbi:MAG TPA: dolichol-phosphate mannosyltransferase [Candidatus Cloacimonas sp.]|jgi:glycosyltransferase involved in cell wall biosynthesis|nr:dolichol-phosphate mannosyltransferase [Candidatus Cloacimonadota bacterium]HCX72648.1 dolichol-phosphate mannosyltransferase [Candidatus Cloacimonas sp.]